MRRTASLVIAMLLEKKLPKFLKEILLNSYSMQHLLYTSVCHKQNIRAYVPTSLETGYKIQSARYFVRLD